MRRTLAYIESNPKFVKIKAEDLGLGGLILTYPRSPAKREEGDPGEPESDDDS